MDIPTEKNPPKDLEPKKKKKPKQELTFARPAFAAEVMTDDGKKRFDTLPSWQRHLIKRLIEHGDLPRAAQEANVSTYVNKYIDAKEADRQSVVEALNHGGITPELLVTHLQDCLKAEQIRQDKHGNFIRCVDLNVKLKTLELIFRLRKDFDEVKNKGNYEELFEDTQV